MTRPNLDHAFATELLTCPLCRTPMHPIESGPAGHRRRCPRCRLVVVLPRVQLRKSIAFDLVAAPRIRRRAS